MHSPDQHGQPRQVNIVEIDNAPPGSWIGIMEGKPVAWARTLPMLRRIMGELGFPREEYIVAKISECSVSIVLIERSPREEM